MAKSKSSAAGKTVLHSYTIEGTHKVVKAGDCVLVRPLEQEMLPYVAKLEKIEGDKRGNMWVKVRWYYRPEEALGGRRKFHGSKELFLSDHYDIQSAYTIEGTCSIHSFRAYTKLAYVGDDDYFCRFEYKPSTGCFVPDRVAVYCKCEMPYNPDDLMVQCEICKDWFHPECMDMSPEQVKRLEHFHCPECQTPEEEKTSYAEGVLYRPKMAWNLFKAWARGGQQSGYDLDGIVFRRAPIGKCSTIVLDE